MFFAIGGICILLAGIVCIIDYIVQIIFAFPMVTRITHLVIFPTPAPYKPFASGRVVYLLTSEKCLLFLKVELPGCEEEPIGLIHFGLIHFKSLSLRLQLYQDLSVYFYKIYSQSGQDTLTPIYGPYFLPRIDMKRPEIFIFF